MFNNNTSLPPFPIINHISFVIDDLFIIIRKEKKEKQYKVFYFVSKYMYTL